MCQQPALYLGQYLKTVFSSFIGVISYPTRLTLFLRQRKLHKHQSHSGLHQHSKLPRDATFTPEVLNIYLLFVSSQISCSLKPNLTFVRKHTACVLFSLSGGKTEFWRLTYREQSVWFLSRSKLHNWHRV